MKNAPDNSYALQAREKKVAKLVDALVESGVTAAVAATLDDVDWQAGARVAKCNPPNSEATKLAVVERLGQIERAIQKRSA